MKSNCSRAGSARGTSQSASISALGWNPSSIVSAAGMILSFRAGREAVGIVNPAAWACPPKRSNSSWVGSNRPNRSKAPALRALARLVSGPRQTAMAGRPYRSLSRPAMRPRIPGGHVSLSTMTTGGTSSRPDSRGSWAAASSIASSVSARRSWFSASMLCASDRASSSLAVVSRSRLSWASPMRPGALSRGMRRKERSSVSSDDSFTRAVPARALIPGLSVFLR